MVPTVHPLGTGRVLTRRKAITRIGGGAAGLATIAALGACTGARDDEGSFEPFAPRRERDADDSDILVDAIPTALAPLISAATRSLPPVRAAALAYLIGVGALAVIESAKSYFEGDEASDEERGVATSMATNENGRFRLPVDKVYRKYERVCWTTMQAVEPRNDQEINGCMAIVGAGSGPVLLEGQALMAIGLVAFAVAREDELTEDDTGQLADLMFPAGNGDLQNVWLANGETESRLPTSSGDLVVTRVDDGDHTTDANIDVTLPDGRAWAAEVPKLTHT